MTVSFHTLGCKTNAYETQAIREQFLQAGFEIGAFNEICDVYVINTCAVTAEASRKSRQTAGRCKKLNPNALVVVTGCYAQEAGELLTDSTGADLVVGNGEKSRIVQLVMSRLDQDEDAQTGKIRKDAAVIIDDQTHMRQFENQSISEQEDHIRAYVKIQDGCDRFCSYCIIPYLRGRSRSRNADAILAETQRLARAGLHEIVLTGIDISSFHMEDCENSSQSLSRLIRMTAAVEGVERVRLGSLEAGIVSEELVSSLKDIPQFCPQFHLSLQSGSDSILKKMNRHYTADEFAASVDMIRKYFPDAGITTDIIAGFPGESEEEFRETMEFVRRVAFSRLHVFPYSRRKGTRADMMQGQLTKAEKERRTHLLMSLGAELRMDYEKRFIGRACPVLIEEAKLIRPYDAACSGSAETPAYILLEGYTPEYVRIRAVRKADPGQKLPDIQAYYVGKILDVIPDHFEKGTLCAADEKNCAADAKQ